MIISNNLTSSNNFQKEIKTEKKNVIIIPVELAIDLTYALVYTAYLISIPISYILKRAISHIGQKIFLTISHNEYNNLIDFKMYNYEGEKDFLRRLSHEVSCDALKAVKYVYDLQLVHEKSWQQAIDYVIQYHEDTAINNLVKAVHSKFYISDWTRARSIRSALIELRQVDRAFKWVQQGMIKKPAKMDKLAFVERLQKMPFLDRPKAYLARAFEKMGNIYRYGRLDIRAEKSPYTLCRETFNNKLSSQELVAEMKKRVFSRLVSYDWIKEESKPFYKRSIMPLKISPLLMRLSH